MLAAVGGGSSGKGGGVFAPTGGSPVGVSDQLLADPGANGFPAPQTGSAKEARNNRGSNEKVPYARLVPVQSSVEPDGNGGMVTTLAPLPASHGMEAQARSHAVKNEYADLKSGELAWVRGNYVRDLGKQTVRPPGILDFGIGPDRFQRLASTSWVERFFYYVHGKDKVQLHKLKITDSRFARGMPLEAPEIVDFGKYLAGSTATNVNDVPFVLASLSGANVPPAESGQIVYTGTPTYADGTAANGGLFKCGLNTTTTSPFLHGFTMDDSFVKVGRVPTKETRVYTVADEPPNAFYEFARNYGDNMAFTALYSHLRSKGFFSWSPDGLTLSKLASPAGDVMASEELDTRSGQLFNVAVAGNSVATTWTGDPSMPSMPGDNVYILLIAEIVTITGDAKDELDKTVLDGINAKEAAVAGAQDAAAEAEAQKKLVEEMAKVFASQSTDDAPSATMEAATASVDDYVNAVAKGAQAEEAAAKRAPTMSDYINNADAGAKAAYDEIAALSQAVRSNNKKVAEATMTNFRWRRSTSSYLAANSAINLRSGHSRCGLGLGFLGGDKSAVKGQWIVGAWRIGTVLDNAASRAGAPSMGVRTAPSSYAISVNVNVQWLSSDALFRRYDGRNVGLVGRGENKPEVGDPHQYLAEVKA